MNTLERMEAALTPGGIFNEKGHIWRTVEAVRVFAGLDHEEDALAVLNGGDLGRPVVYKVSTKGEKKLMVAFRDLADGENQPVLVVAGNAVAPEPNEDLVAAAAVAEAQQEVVVECAEVPLSVAPEDHCGCQSQFCEKCADQEFDFGVGPEGASDGNGCNCGEDL